MNKEHKLMISKAPDDPEEKKAWVKQMLRIQVAMWVDDGAECAHCHVKYASTDDFLDRNPKRGYGDAMTFVDEKCWEAYEKENKPQ